MRAHDNEQYNNDERTTSFVFDIQFIKMVYTLNWPGPIYEHRLTHSLTHTDELSGFSSTWTTYYRNNSTIVALLCILLSIRSFLPFFFVWKMKRTNHSTRNEELTYKTEYFKSYRFKAIFIQFSNFEFLSFISFDVCFFSGEYFIWSIYDS